MAIPITVVGNLTADVELRFMPSGVAMATFTVAVNKRVKDGEQWKDGPTRRSNQREAPSKAPKARPALEPMTKPQALRCRLADSALQSSPLVTWSTARSQTASGETSSGVSTAPEPTAQDHSARISSGSTQPRRLLGMG